MAKPCPTWSRYAWFMLGFNLYTLPAGLWGWRAGVPFWDIMPGCLIAGVVGGGFLSVICHVLKTGYMQRSSQFYRFSERPVTFVMDCLLSVMGVALALCWPVGYALQEMAA